MGPRMLMLVLLLAELRLGALDGGIESPLRVAQCRASCLEKFSGHGPNSDASCLKGPDCYMCWENCELLHSNFPVWGAMCQERNICFPGCREACKFLNEAGSRIHQLQPVIHTKVESVVRVTDVSLRWPRPSTAKPHTPLVYVVMRKLRHGTWRQIAQTVCHAAELSSGNAIDEDSILRVLVVDSKGLLAVYSPLEGQEKWRNKKNKKKKVSSEEEHTAVGAPGEWVLREVSLIHQRVLVIGEIAWEPKVHHGVYLVTWEVDGGGLRGNLFTDSTCVTLSLWPDTIYHIQVELVSPVQGVPDLKSKVMDLDTRTAQSVVTDKLEPSSSSSTSPVSSVRDSSSSFRGLEVSSGVALAVLSTFALVVLAWGWRRWRRDERRLRRMVGLKSSVIEKPLEGLKGFPPIVTVVAPEATPSANASQILPQAVSS